MIDPIPFWLSWLIAGVRLIARWIDAMLWCHLLMATSPGEQSVTGMLVSDALRIGKIDVSRPRIVSEQQTFNYCLSTNVWILVARILTPHEISINSFRCQFVHNLIEHTFAISYHCYPKEFGTNFYQRD